MARGQQPHSRCRPAVKKLRCYFFHRRGRRCQQCSLCQLRDKVRGELIHGRCRDAISSLPHGLQSTALPELEHSDTKGAHCTELHEVLDGTEGGLLSHQCTARQNTKGVLQAQLCMNGALQYGPRRQKWDSSISAKCLMLKDGTSASF